MINENEGHESFDGCSEWGCTACTAASLPRMALTAAAAHRLVAKRQGSGDAERALAACSARRHALAHSPADQRQECSRQDSGSDSGQLLFEYNRKIVAEVRECSRLLSSLALFKTE